MGCDFTLICYVVTFFGAIARGLNVPLVEMLLDGATRLAICGICMIFICKSGVGWLLEIGTDPWKLTGWFLGFITITLKQIKDLIPVYNHGSQTFVEFVFQWTGHKTRSLSLILS
jgi:hypothetical protein